MLPKRREFLKLLALGAIGLELDVDKLLWIPGQKKIFIPSTRIRFEEIIELEMKRILPLLHNFLTRDNLLYETLEEQNEYQN